MSEEKTIAAEIKRIVQSVNEWDDRTSPDDFPEALLITSEELTEILRDFAAEISTFSTKEMASESDVIDFLYKHGDLTYGAAYAAVRLLYGNGYSLSKATA